MKYSAKLHLDPNNINKVKYIGSVESNSIRDLKQKAKDYALNWNHRGKISIDCDNTGFYCIVNVY